MNNPYSAAMASTGQTPAQEPQSLHLPGSIQRRLSFSEIASVGHSLSQEPQLTHASLILYAISYLSLLGCYEDTIPRKKKQGKFSEEQEFRFNPRARACVGTSRTERTKPV
jgi:hypothetical protein